MSSKNITARKGDKFPAERLDFTDIGKTIRVMTDLGAVITDVLAFIQAGPNFNVMEGSSKISVGFKHVAPHGYPDSFGGRMFDLAPTAIVTVVALAKTDG